MGYVELAFAVKRTRQPGPRLALLVMLKTFQRLGHFAQPDAVNNRFSPPRLPLLLWRWARPRSPNLMHTARRRVTGSKA